MSSIMFPRPDLRGPFRNNMEEFIVSGRLHQEVIFDCPDSRVWSLNLPVFRHNQPHMHLRRLPFPLTIQDIEAMWKLFIVKRVVREAPDGSYYSCAPCSMAGLGDNLVSKLQYHFVLYDRNVNLRNSILNVAGPRSRLQATIHSNGFGHLFFSNRSVGTEEEMEMIMNFWDDLCTVLKTRTMTLIDYYSLKFLYGSFGHNLIQDNMLYNPSNLKDKLLYGVSFGGQNWYGMWWGYKVCWGSFGFSEADYSHAIKLLGELNVDSLMEGEGEFNHIVTYYRSISRGLLVRLEDLLGFLMARACRNFAKIIARLSHRYSADALGKVGQVFLRELQAYKIANGNRGMPRRQAREAIRRVLVGYKKIIDVVLTAIDCVAIDENYVIIRRVNSATDLEEYFLYGSEDTHERRDIHGDLDFIYNSMICSTSEPIKTAVEKILRSQHYLKEWNVNGMVKGEMFKSLCRVVLGENVLQPGEYVWLPPDSVLSDVKQHAERAFRETYFVTENIFVMDIVGQEGVNDMTSTITLKLRSGPLQLRANDLQLTATELNWTTTLRYESGSRKFHCSCDQEEEDVNGEMVQCESCGLWRHPLFPEVA